MEGVVGTHELLQVSTTLSNCFSDDVVGDEPFELLGEQPDPGISSISDETLEDNCR